MSPVKRLIIADSHVGQGKDDGRGGSSPDRDRKESGSLGLQTTPQRQTRGVRQRPENRPLQRADQGCLDQEDE